MKGQISTSSRDAGGRTSRARATEHRTPLGAKLKVQEQPMATVPRLLTYEEWLRMPPVEDGTDEVVKGELRFMPPTHYPHAEIIQRLIERFVGQVDRKSVGILGSNFGLMISREPLTCRCP